MSGCTSRRCGIDMCWMAWGRTCRLAASRGSGEKASEAWIFLQFWMVVKVFFDASDEILHISLHRDFECSGKCIIKTAKGLLHALFITWILRATRGSFLTYHRYNGASRGDWWMRGAKVLTTDKNAGMVSSSAWQELAGVTSRTKSPLRRDSFNNQYLIVKMAGTPLDIIH